MLLTRIRCATLVGAGLLATASTASAHHLMGGKTPSTFAEGIASGLGHPIIGPDHLAFLIALGIAVGVARLSFVNPFLFLVAMACGVAAHVAAITIPAAELIVALSVLVAGLLLVVDRHVPTGWWMGLFVVAGFFHGYAYGESIYGASSDRTDGWRRISNARNMDALWHSASPRRGRNLWCGVHGIGRSNHPSPLRLQGGCDAGFAKLVRLSRTSIADEMREEHRRRVLGE